MPCFLVGIGFMVPYKFFSFFFTPPTQPLAFQCRYFLAWGELIKKKQKQTLDVKYQIWLVEYRIDQLATGLQFFKKEKKHYLQVSTK